MGFGGKRRSCGHGAGATAKVEWGAGAAGNRQQRGRRRGAERARRRVRAPTAAPHPRPAPTFGRTPSAFGHKEVPAGIEAALLALGPPWNALPVVLETSGGFSGSHRGNVVNRITGFGNGVQVEQPEAVRKGARVRDAVADAVARVYLRQGGV